MNDQGLKKYFKGGTGIRKVVDYLRFLHLSMANHFVAYFPSYEFRKFCYRYLYGMKIGYHSQVQMGVRFYSPYKIAIGKHCSIGNNSLLDARRGITIGNHVDIAGYVKILTLGHDLDDPEYKTTGHEVVIEDFACIYTGASILPGVRVAEGSVVALDAVLTKDTEPWTIYAGNPARPIRKRKIDTLTYRRNYKRFFH